MKMKTLDPNLQPGEGQSIVRIGIDGGIPALPDFFIGLDARLVLRISPYNLSYKKVLDAELDELASADDLSVFGALVNLPAEDVARAHIQLGFLVGRMFWEIVA